jgi:hypothetical protein
VARPWKCVWFSKRPRFDFRHCNRVTRLIRDWSEATVCSLQIISAQASVECARQIFPCTKGFRGRRCGMGRTLSPSSSPAEQPKEHAEYDADYDASDQREKIERSAIALKYDIVREPPKFDPRQDRPHEVGRRKFNFLLYSGIGCPATDHGCDFHSVPRDRHGHAPSCRCMSIKGLASEPFWSASLRAASSALQGSIGCPRWR